MKNEWRPLDIEDLVGVTFIDESAVNKKIADAEDRADRMAEIANALATEIERLNNSPVFMDTETWTAEQVENIWRRYLKLKDQGKI